MFIAASFLTVVTGNNPNSLTGENTENLGLTMQPNTTTIMKQGGQTSKTLLREEKDTVRATS